MYVLLPLLMVYVFADYKIIYARRCCAVLFSVPNLFLKMLELCVPKFDAKTTVLIMKIKNKIKIKTEH